MAAFDIQRFLNYLRAEKGAPRAFMSALLPRFSIALDEIDFAAHDRRYHHGHFNPATMTCAMRDAINTGDLADVLTAEREEEERVVDYYIHHPQELSDDDFVAMLGNPEMGARCKFKHVLKNMYRPGSCDGKGDVVGICKGLPVQIHRKMFDEYAMSRNSGFLAYCDHSGYRRKIWLARHLGNVFSKIYKCEDAKPAHESKRHGKWEIALGFRIGYFQDDGNEWYCVFARPDENRLLLYDIVKKVDGK